MKIIVIKALCALVLGLSALAQAQVATAARVGFPEVGMAIVQPKGFDKAESFYGFQHPASGASVLLTSIPGPYAEVTRGFNRDGLASRGMELKSIENVRIDDKPGLLLYAAQRANGQDFMKWMVAFGDERATKLVTATFPGAAAPQLNEPMKQVVLSVSTTLPPDQQASVLPFTVTPVDGMAQSQQVSAMGKMLAFTKDGSIPLAAVTDPLFIVAPSVGGGEVTDRHSYATKRLHATAGTRIESITLTNELTIDGAPALEMLAAGVDEKSNTPLAIYQVMLFPADGGYVLMTGLVGRAASSEYLLKFRAMAHSFRRNAS